MSESLEIDVNGCTLLNVGGITSDPDDVVIISSYETTVTNAATTLFAYSTVANAVYSGSVHVIAKESADVSHNWAYIFDIVITNVAGAATVRILRSQYGPSVAPSTIACVPQCVGDVFSLAITGDMGRTLRWKAIMRMTRNN
ncbi:MAG: hypothetical protein PHN45_00300 [Methylococcales bacterium]|nr:hypothetical protein [Methylococcales bacterium]